MNRWAYPALAFLTGAGVMVYEFAAPKLFGGYFGQTIYVWANVIGVILAALAAGYALGGRWADRTRSVLPLGIVLAVAGAYGLLVASIGHGVCAWLAGPEEYTQDAALPAFVAESLAATLLLFTVPVAALGMATPLMVQRCSVSWPVGGAAGAIFAVGTVGSIAGIYLTTFAFLDWWGVTTTIRVAGAGLLVLAVVVLGRGGRRGAAAACLLPLGLWPVGGAAPWESLPPAGSRLVLARESPYQLIRVVDRPVILVHVRGAVPETARMQVAAGLERLPEVWSVEPDADDADLRIEPLGDPRETLARVRERLPALLPSERGVRVEATLGYGARWLAFDEGMGTYHSMRVEPGTLWTGAYYDAFARLPEWVGGEGPLRCCIVGNASGTMSQLLHAHHGADALRIDGVEIDPEVTRASREAMGLVDREHPALTLHHEDGRTFLARRPETSYDAIVLDAYARQVSIPASLATREFFALAKSRLREGGMLFVNLGALRPGSHLVHVIADTIQAGFGTPVARAPLAGQSNVLLVAARGGFPRPPPRDSELGIWHSFGRHVAGGTVLTDDHCPVERLTAEDLRLE